MRGIHRERLLVDLNWDRINGLNDPVKQRWYGRGMAASLLYDHALVEGGRVSAAIGLGVASHNYYTDGVVTKIDSTNQVYFRAIDTDTRKRGNLSITYGDVPIELRFRSKPDARGDQWKAAIGARVGYKLAVHEKYVTATDQKFKTYYYPQVALFRYGATARVGYGALMLTAFYSISDLFDPGVGIVPMNTFTLGLTITPF